MCGKCYGWSLKRIPNFKLTGTLVFCKHCGAKMMTGARSGVCSCTECKRKFTYDKEKNKKYISKYLKKRKENETKN